MQKQLLESLYETERIAIIVDRQSSKYTNCVAKKSRILEKKSSKKVFGARLILNF